MHFGCQCTVSQSAYASLDDHTALLEAITEQHEKQTHQEMTCLLAVTSHPDIHKDAPGNMACAPFPPAPQEGRLRIVLLVSQVFDCSQHDISPVHA